jgi:hypothetical protein
MILVVYVLCFFVENLVTIFILHAIINTHNSSLFHQSLFVLPRFIF